MASSSPAEVALAFASDAATLERAIAQLERDGERSGGAVDAEMRREALALFGTLPMLQGNVGRGWRYDYAKLPMGGLQWSSGRQSVPTIPFSSADDVDPDVDRPALATENSGGIVHIGATLLEPRDAKIDPRIVVTSLAHARRDHADLLAPVQHKIARWRTDRFAALATAFQNCGAFVYVPDGVVLDAPIQLLFVNGEAETAAVFPHVVVILGRGAKASVLERYAGEGDTFISGIVEAQLGDNAQLDYVTVQRGGEEARVLNYRAAHCGHDATMRFHLADLGGALVRSVVESDLAATGSHAEVAALFFTGSTQHVDLTTSTQHSVGPTTSNTVVRSAATDQGQGRFFGNIAILAKAHGSDASLRDDALLLSKRAHIDSVPALEIAANDVKAFHGATVGSVDEEQLFYARSRGIARADALRMIALGFFEPVISRFPGERLRDEIRTALDGKIDEATEIDA
ncbi:MAG: hypothetical protein NVS3B28_23650 [Candidatus Velthaea sp.]